MNKQSGNNHKKWKYFEAMHEILFSRPEITPRATCSTKRGIIVNGRPADTLENVTSGKLIIDYFLTFVKKFIYLNTFLL